MQNWFKPYFKTDGDGFPLDVTGTIHLVPLELKFLGALRVLTKGYSFLEVAECTQGDHEEVHRTFFYEFCEVLIEKLFASNVYLPRNDEELDLVMNIYSHLGFPGCCFSMDCVHIKWKNCPFKYRNSYYSYKNGCSAVSYNVSCSHSGFIQTVSNGYYATWGDDLIVRFDDAVLPLINNPLFTNKEYTLNKSPIATVKRKGVYGLTDNGYFRCCI